MPKDTSFNRPEPQYTLFVLVYGKDSGLVNSMPAAPLTVIRDKFFTTCQRGIARD